MPLDVNLPTFHLAPRPREPHVTTLSYTSNGSAPQATYNKTVSTEQQNTYTTTLHDAFVPDILYASITAHPEIQPAAATSPGGTPADPKVLLPSEFVISLFNPDSTVLLEHHHSALRGTYWEFSLPKTSFLPPTSSKLDAASSAAVLANLPRATFRWRKEGGLVSRPQLRCSLVSPANLPSVPGTASASKKAGANEPDIPIAMFLGLGEKKGIGEITVIQSNLKRVEVEDLKGLEVVLLLSAMAIGDIWFQPTNQMFNLNPPTRGSASGTARRKNSIPPAITPVVTVSTPQPRSPPTTSPQHGKPPPDSASFATRFQERQKGQSRQRRYSTPIDSDSEYARRVQEEETRKRLIAEKELEQIHKMLAEEESRERRRREEEVDRETERLLKIYTQDRAEYMARGARNAASQRPVSQQRQAPQQRSVSQQRPAGRPPVVGGGTGMMMPTPARTGTGRTGTGMDEKKLGNRKSFLGLKFGSSSSDGKTKEKEKKKKKLSKK